jgi:hypothetical protein
MKKDTVVVNTGFLKRMIGKSLFKIPTVILVGLITLITVVFVLPCLPAQAADATPECWAVIAAVSDYLEIKDLHNGTTSIRHNEFHYVHDVILHLFFDMRLGKSSTNWGITSD